MTAAFRESPQQHRKRAGALLRRLRRRFPHATTELRWDGDPWHLLAATILSAQCTDARVNQVIPELFRRFPSLRAVADSPPGELEQVIRSTGFYNNKAKSLRGAAAAILANHGGRVPDSMEALLALPGVARKTANCVMGTAFGKSEGIVVDTHVARLARRLGFSLAQDPVKIEQDLMALFPRRSWTFLAHALILHGRATCSARKPRCEACSLAELCPKLGVQ